MGCTINLETLLRGCDGDSFDDGIRIDTELEPLAGSGSPVKPAVYDGGVYQQDRRWATPEDEESTPVIGIDNVPSQANRLEEALRRNRESTGVPEPVSRVGKRTASRQEPPMARTKREVKAFALHRGRRGGPHVRVRAMACRSSADSGHGLGPPVGEFGRRYAGGGGDDLWQ